MSRSNKLNFLVSVILTLALLLPCFVISPLKALASEDNRVTATTSTSVKQGSSGYCYVYIDSLENLSSLSVTVHFDPEKVSVSSTYNSVSAVVYDSNNGESSLQYSYIFDGNGTTSKTRLFYFNYKVLSDAEVGETYFDIVVTDAYNNELNTVSVGGSRTSFEITETIVNKSCYVYSTSSLSTKVKGEFELSYRVSAYDIASGSFYINYDPELFEIVSVTEGKLLNGKVYDINKDLLGAVYVSFVGDKNSYTDLLKLKLRTKKNAQTVSDIKLTVTEFCDKDFNIYTCNGYTTKVTVNKDPEYLDDAPAMTVSTSYNSKSSTLTAVIKLDAFSHLGAGDFELSFDPEILTYISSTKNLNSSFFTVNDKKVSEGVLKFSVISMEDIITEETVITVELEAKHNCDTVITALTLQGSGISDSLTNPILLNVLGTDAVMDASGHIWTDWTVVKEATENESGTKKRICTVCGIEQSEEYTLPPKPTTDLNENLKFKSAQVVMYNTISMFYNVDKALLSSLGYSNPQVVFTFNGIETVVSEYEDNGTYYVFEFSNIYSYQLNDNIAAVLYAKDSYGNTYYSKTQDYSVATYCYNRIEKSTNEAMRTLAVDILNYGAAAQIYFGVNTNNLANAKLTDEQKLLASAEVTPVSSTNKNYEVIEGALAEWKSATLIFEDSICIRYKVIADSVEGMTAKLRDTSGREWTVASSEFENNGDGTYFIYFKELNATEFREVVYITLYKNGEKVSNTLSYGIESYAASKYNSTTPGLADLVKTMMKYGNSAKKYHMENN